MFFREFYDKGSQVSYIMSQSSFTPEQIEQIRTLAETLRSVGELQTQINETFGTRLTYLETRFLMDDFALELAEPKSSVPEPKPQTSNDPLEGDVVDEGNSGSVKVSVDPVTRPGKVVNGTVTFSDGKTANWGLDALGRLSLSPTQIGYRPSQEDMIQFQEALQEQLANGRSGLRL